MMEVEVDMGEGGGRPVMAREDFSRYYALGPELEEMSMGVEGVEEEEGEEEWRRRVEEGRMEMEKQREEWRRNLNSGELSDDSGVKDGEESEGDEEENEEEEAERKEREKERHAWKAGSVPQDLVASVQGLRVVREEPKPWQVEKRGEKDVGRRVVRQQPRAIAGVHGEEKTGRGEVEEQDVTEYMRQRQQAEAYTNLEDLLDVAWEEEDLAPPTKVGINSLQNVTECSQNRRLDLLWINSCIHWIRADSQNCFPIWQILKLCYYLQADMESAIVFILVGLYICVFRC